jgi:enolase-phosphatase E1
LNPPAGIITDIEGTTTPIAFVAEKLFPYARAALPNLLAHQASDPEIAAELHAVPGPDKLATLLGWMDKDVKATPLKALQGIIWRDGYASGALRGELYPDVAACLHAWHRAGIKLAVYSSGSVEAQQLLFRHSTSGDLAGLFSAFFDTKIGAKREAASYRRIAESLGLPPKDLLFLSDIEAELDAAASAGLQTCQLVRPQDRTVASDRHGTAPDFASVNHMLALRNGYTPMPPS